MKKRKPHPIHTVLLDSRTAWLLGRALSLVPMTGPLGPPTRADFVRIRALSRQLESLGRMQEPDGFYFDHEKRKALGPSPIDSRTIEILNGAVTDLERELIEQRDELARTPVPPNPKAGLGYLEKRERSKRGELY